MGVKTMTEAPIIKKDTQILTPRLWYLMREKLNPKYMIICDVLINTGMRTEEFWEFVDHPQWYSASRRCIDLPKGSIGKTRCTMKERTVLLSPEGAQAVQTLIGANSSIRYTDRSTMRRYLIAHAKEAGLSEKGITTKMFRKTLVSWLVATVPEKDHYIINSIGHSQDVQDRHYLSIGFARKDVDDMRKFLKGWGE
jgi:integrase